MTSIPDFNHIRNAILEHAERINPTASSRLSLLTTPAPDHYPALQAHVVSTYQHGLARILCSAWSLGGEIAAMRELLRKMQGDSARILGSKRLGEGCEMAFEEDGEYETCGRRGGGRQIRLGPRYEFDDNQERNSTLPQAATPTSRLTSWGANVRGDERSGTQVRFNTEVDIRAAPYTDNGRRHAASTRDARQGQASGGGRRYSSTGNDIDFTPPNSPQQHPRHSSRTAGTSPNHLMFGSPTPLPVRQQPRRPLPSGRPAAFSTLQHPAGYAQVSGRAEATNPPRRNVGRYQARVESEDEYEEW